MPDEVVERIRMFCAVCGKRFKPRQVQRCPRCHSPNWDRDPAWRWSEEAKQRARRRRQNRPLLVRPLDLSVLKS